MALNIPTMDELVKKTRQSFNANLTGVDAFLSPNFLFVTSKVLGIAMKPLYYLVDYVSRQIFAGTADTEFLVRHASAKGLSRLPASKAQGYVVVTSTAGQNIATNALMTTSDGREYKVVSGITTTGTDSVLVISTSDGASYNLFGGTKLSLSVSNPLVTNIEVADTAISGGSDIETDDSLRARVQIKERTFDISGTRGYYENFLKQEVAGITRIFIDNGVGSFSIYFMMDNTYSNGIPLSQDVINAQAVADDIKVLGTIPTMIAPVEQKIDVSLTVFEPITQATQEQIILELKETIIEEGEVSTGSIPYSLARENLDGAISRALQGGNFEVTSPSANIEIDFGKIPVLGNVTISISG